MSIIIEAPKLNTSDSDKLNELSFIGDIKCVEYIDVLLGDIQNINNTLPDYVKAVLIWRCHSDILYDVRRRCTPYNFDFTNFFTNYT